MEVVFKGRRVLTSWKNSVTIGIASLALFLIITVLVVSRVSQTADMQGLLLVNKADLGQVGIWIMVQSSTYGREVVWSLLVLIMLLLGGKRTKLLAIELSILLVAGIVIGDAAKLLVQRPRPSTSQVALLVQPDFDFSYPSGHALIVSIGAAFCLARFRNRILAGLLAVEAGIVCYSRVYVGVHYPLDVIGGILLGTAVALLGTCVLEKYSGRYLQDLSGLAVRLWRDGPVNL